MARSLTVKHDEEARTTPLFNVFLGVAILWLLLSALGGAFAPATANGAPPAAPALDNG